MDALIQREKPTAVQKALRNTVSKKSHLGAAACSAVLLAASLGAGSVSADESASPAASAKTTWAVDMSGRPPYTRTRVPVQEDIVDVAALETMENVETEVIWERSNRGAPPFSRQRVEVPVVDAAALEIGPVGSSEVQFRGRPPFKRHK